MEQSVAIDFARAGYIAYLPMTATRRRNRAGEMVKVLVPRMPGYLFVQLTLPGQPWSDLRFLNPAFRGLLTTATFKPARVPDTLVDAMKRADAEMCELRATPGVKRREGAAARIAVGAWADFSGRVVSCDGLTTRVEIEVFGRLLAVDVGYDQVRVAGEPAR